MRNNFALLLALASLLNAADYRVALPGYRYEFPRDHFNHPDFQTEWWYYTGNLRAADGHRFGFELTFFRQGVNPAADSGVWEVRDVWMAHLALSDIDGQRFLHTQRLNRSGAGMAGADLKSARVWNGNWSTQWDPKDFQSQTLTAVDDKFSFRLAMHSEKPPVIHGKSGVSQKAAGEGRASHYISFTRLLTTGEVVLEGKTFSVEGVSWMDHEYFTEQLAVDLVGWDWFSLQFDDGTDAMLYRLRKKDGSADSFSAGTFVDAQGRSTPIGFSDFSATPLKEWISPQTGTHYVTEWAIKIPSRGIDITVSTRLANQELVSKIRGNPSYWEGAIDISGSKPGRGYLEMTRALSQ